MQPQFKPNQVEIAYVTLTNFAGQQIDISNIFINIEIEEDIYSSVMMGRLTIAESQDFHQVFPIIGEETLDIKFRTDKSTSWRILSFYCYALADKRQIGQKMAYTLPFSSVEYLQNRNGRMTEAFTNMNAGSIISSIVANNLASSKKVNTSNTSQNISFVSTNIYPFAVISSICSRSTGAKHNDNGLVFFETMDGFQFQSIDDMIDGTPIVYTYSDRSGINQDTDTLTTINNVEIDESHNVLQRMIDGTFGSNVVIFDPLYRTATTSTWDYFNDTDYGNLNMMSGQSTLKRVQTSKFQFQDANKLMMVVENGVRSSGRAKRIARLNWLESGYRIRVEVPGNSDLHVGAMINAQFPSKSGDDIEAGTKRQDRFVSGNYFNKSMIHSITRSTVTKYICTCEWVKDSYQRNIETEQPKLNKRIQTTAS